MLTQHIPDSSIHNVGGDPLCGLARPNRRRFLTALGASLGTTAFALRVEASPPRHTADAANPVRVTKERLNKLAAKFYSVFNENKILAAEFPAKHAARFDVELRRITTFTRIPETGERVKVSGLLAVPAGQRGAVPLVSWQHGTILSFDQVPSNLTRLADESYNPQDNVDSIETLFNIQRFTGNGYAVIAADYLGKGPYRNGRGEAYVVKGATVRCCMDVLQAGTAELNRLGMRPSALFLNGWSQGAVNTQWLKQELQRRHVRVVATATQSPFNNLAETFHYWVDPSFYIRASDSGSYTLPPVWITPCIIVLLGSYRQYYGLNNLFETAIKPQHRAFAEKYWQDYSLDAATANAIPQLADFLTDGLLDRFTSDTNSSFLRHLGRNSTTFWPYDTPINFYYGLADEALHPSLVKMAVASAGRFGNGIAIDGASHRSTFLASLYGEKAVLNGHLSVPEWFASLL